MISWKCPCLILLAAAAASPAVVDSEIFLTLGPRGTGARFGLNLGFNLILAKWLEAKCIQKPLSSDQWTVSHDFIITDSLELISPPGSDRKTQLI